MKKFAYKSMGGDGPHQPKGKTEREPLGQNFWKTHVMTAPIHTS